MSTFQVAVVWLLLGDAKDGWIAAFEASLAEGLVGDPLFAVEKHSVWTVVRECSTQIPESSPILRACAEYLVKILSLEHKPQYARILALAVRAVWELTSRDPSGILKRAFSKAAALEPLFR